MRTKFIPLAMSVVCAAAVFSTSGPVLAQAAGKTAVTAASRAEAEAERKEFLRTHEWVADHWELKGAAPAKGGKARAEIKAERDAFLRVNRWDPAEGAWVSMTGAPRDVSKLPRDQVKSEALEFHRMYVWDEPSGKYIQRRAPLVSKAQPAATAASRAEAEAERKEFLRTHEWVADHWELKGAAPAKGGKVRAEIKAERDAFLRVNRWDPAEGAWVSMTGAPREVSKLPRDQVKSEALEFHRMYEWDEPSSKFIARRQPLRAK